MNHCVLIGGGSGLIGTRLTEILKQKGCEVRHLGRKAKDGPVRTFEWDIHRLTMDERAFEGVTAVINLAGANVNGRRWTKEYKEEILTSRTNSTKLIVDFLNNGSHQVTNFISGSAVGYYGLANSPKHFHEADPAATDFMAQVVVEWERSADELKNKQVKLAHVRIGIVLSERGGALVEMARPIRLFAGAPLGSGKQIVSWIHIEDTCGIFAYILEHDLIGTFNAVAPEPASNEELTRAIAKKIHRPVWPIGIPEFVLKMAIGQMSEAVLNGSRVSSEKIQAAGFRFKYPTLDSALGQPETGNL